MEVPKDLGRRIVEASRLAVALHLQRVFGLESQPRSADVDRPAPLNASIVSANSVPRELAEREAE